MSPSNNEAMAKLVAELQVKFPSDYESFLEQHNGEREVYVHGDTWFLYTIQELLEPASKRMKPKVVPMARYMRHFMTDMAEFDAGDQIDVIDQASLPAGRVAEMLCIGTCSGSADYLLLDCFTRKVYAFYTDGIYLKHCTNSFQDLLQLPQEAEEE